MSLMSIFFSTWLHLIDLFFYWPHFVGFGFFERYVGITFVEEKIYFGILFSTPFEAYKTSMKELK